MRQCQEKKFISVPIIKKRSEKIQSGHSLQKNTSLYLQQESEASSPRLLAKFSYQLQSDPYFSETMYAVDNLLQKIAGLLEKRNKSENKQTCICIVRSITLATMEESEISNQILFKDKPTITWIGALPQKYSVNTLPSYSFRGLPHANRIYNCK